MQNSKHCKICQNLNFNIEYGTKCDLTNEKPNFLGKCPKIEFGNNLEKVITETSVENKLIEKDKLNYIGTFFIYLFISIGFIVGGIFLIQKLFGVGFFHTGTLVIIGVGFLALPKAFGSLNTYYQKKNVAEKKIKELKELLRLYKRGYDIKIEIENIHGINEVKSKVKIFRT